MLKYQVRTLQRGETRRRKSILDENAGLSSPVPETPGPSFRNSGSSSSSCESSSSLLSPNDTWRNTGNLRSRGRSCSVSSLSSAGSSTESPVEWGTLKIHTDSIRPETDYKTFFISTATTAADVVRMALSKFRLGYRDPKLFYLAMVVQTKKEGVDVENLLVLDQNAKPLELQACHPKEKSRFILQMRPGTPIRIYDYCLLPESNYKSILISRKTTCAEAVALVLQSHRLPFPRENFVLVSVDTRTGYEFILPPEAYLVNIEEQADEYNQLHLRSFSQARLSLTSAPKQKVPSTIVEQIASQFDPRIL